jgi:hypothetical protein
MISVAIVIPEIGFDEEPMSPVMRDDTVAKKKPNSTMRIDTTMLPCVGRPGITMRKSASAAVPASTTTIGMSRSVRMALVVPPAPKPFSPSRADEMIVGRVRASVISPAASTAPAPM